MKKVFQFTTRTLWYTRLIWIISVLLFGVFAAGMIGLIKQNIIIPLYISIPCGVIGIILAILLVLILGYTIRLDSEKLYIGHVFKVKEYDMNLCDLYKEYKHGFILNIANNEVKIAFSNKYKEDVKKFLDEIINN